MAKNDSLLPEDTASEGADQDFDVSDLRVNFSEEEAQSEGRTFDPIPGGKYVVTIHEWEVRKSGPNAKHPGKPYWALQLKVQEGPHEGRVLFANVMLFEGALYSLSQLLKALGRGDAIKSGKIPNCDELVGEPFVALVTKKVDKYKIEQGEWDQASGEPKPMKNDVSGFKPLDALKSGGGSNSLLPG